MMQNALECAQRFYASGYKLYITLPPLLSTFSFRCSFRILKSAFRLGSPARAGSGPLGTAAEVFSGLPLAEAAYPNL